MSRTSCRNFCSDFSCSLDPGLFLGRDTVKLGFWDLLARRAEQSREAERQAQARQDLPPLNAWHMNLNSIAEINKPWLPPRRVRGPGRP